MTGQELQNRYQKCVDENLCFISLRELTKENSIMVRHPELKKEVLILSHLKRSSCLQLDCRGGLSVYEDGD